MYRKEKSIQMKSSASALYNNLSVLPISDKSLTYFTVVHSNTVNMVSASADGLNFSHRQLQSKEGSMAVSSSLITQASWCVLPSRVLLVLTSQKGIQMYESDGSIMVYWHALDALETPPAQAVFARGIAAASGQYICVGTSSGLVLVFDIPAKGTNITLAEVLAEHRDPITDIASESCEGKDGTPDLVTADDSGVLCVWKSGEDFKLLNKISAYGRGLFVSDPYVHLQLLSGAEDSFVQIWQLNRSAETGFIEVEHRHAECVTDTQICGARFCDPQGTSFAVTGYDLSEIIRYVQI
ncbi:WD repeat-containing protein 54 [Bombina bombina]|uniref:WD repeat-containing protein 54 n=1 Tax=Bombina bombina TaxID=8345 RepID=UPI00235A6403|nr:WD repeat-containing protein 54 [Bombina bombina]